MLKLQIMKKIILSLIVITALCQCKSGWTDAQKEKGSKACSDAMKGTVEEKVAKRYCDCVMDQAMKKYKNYDEMNTKGTEADGREMGMKCAGELLAK
jgi:hypothetical protein